jgi:hypothetical protein
MAYKLSFVKLLAGGLGCEWVSGLLFNGNSATIQAEFELVCLPITLNLNVNNEINRILHNL